jgi:hypothetical protein
MTCRGSLVPDILDVKVVEMSREICATVLELGCMCAKRGRTSTNGKKDINEEICSDSKADGDGCGEVVSEVADIVIEIEMTS